MIMTEGVMARLGRWCFRRRRIVLGLWLVATISGGLAFGPVFGRLTTDNVPRQLESVQAGDILNAGTDDGGQVIGLVDRVDPGSTQVRDVVRRKAAELDAL